MCDKNLKLSLILSIIFLLESLGGCTSYITSEKFTGTESGRQYCLPIQAMFFEKKMTTKDDGTRQYVAGYQVIDDIPDNTHRYTLEEVHIFTDYTAETKPLDGTCLLTDYNLNNNIPDDLTKSVGETIGLLGNKALEIENTNKTNEQTKQDTKTSTLSSTEDKVSDAEINLKAANQKLKLLQDLQASGENVTQDQISQAKLSIGDATIALNKLKEVLKQLQEGKRNSGPPADEIKLNDVTAPILGWTIKQFPYIYKLIDKEGKPVLDADGNIVTVVEPDADLVPMLFYDGNESRGQQLLNYPTNNSSENKIDCSDGKPSIKIDEYKVQPNQNGELVLKPKLVCGKMDDIKNVTASFYKKADIPRKSPINFEVLPLEADKIPVRLRTKIPPGDYTFIFKCDGCEVSPKTPTITVSK